MARAASISQIYSTKFKTFDFKEKFLDSFGKPETKGTWLIWADSGHGKTTFVLQLCKYLATHFGKVAYNSMEEGISESLMQAMRRVGFERTLKNNFILIDNEPLDKLKERLKKQKAPKIVVIDSWQYTEGTYTNYLQLKDEFPNTLFIIIAQAEGKLPEGKVCKKIRFDANVKINVEGYVAFVKSRYTNGVGKPFIIWEKGAADYHGLSIINTPK